MSKNQMRHGKTMFLVALVMSLSLIGSSQAQDSQTGSFTLNNPIRWGSQILQSGNYTITFNVSSSPATTLIRDGHGRTVALVTAMVRDENPTLEKSALFLKEKNGQMCVYSLALANVKTILTYDPALARRAILESRIKQTVPVVLAKK